ncbi:hypothetical protein C8Q78DRAFT_1052126 [Trametes maxima]|nr:hypothetical protein C8Q78DRAFT_1052126 [Trametes maxima]
MLCPPGLHAVTPPRLDVRACLLQASPSARRYRDCSPRARWMPSRGTRTGKPARSPCPRACPSGFTEASVFPPKPLSPFLSCTGLANVYGPSPRRLCSSVRFEGCFTGRGSPRLCAYLAV